MPMAIISMALALLPASAPSATCGDRTLHAETVSLTAGDGDVLVRIRDKGGAEDGLRLRLASIARGSGPGCTPDAARLWIDDRRVCFERGTLEERYELRGDGVEQSFVFAELPGGEGDLVVRVEVETALAVVEVEPDQVSFERASENCTTRLTLGGIVGIDAGGARVDGSMAWSEGVLELRIPGDFVHAAALPLVVDPLITGEILLSSEGLSAGIAPTSSVAYLPEADRYLAVWRAGGEDDPRGRLIAGDGTPLGIFGSVFNQLSYGDDPSVASSRPARRFVAATIGGIFGSVNPWVATIDEDGETLHDARILSVTVNSIDVGGEATLQGGDVLVVFAGQGELRVCRIDAETLELRENLLLATGADVQVAITPSGGTSGRYLVIWTRQGGGQEDLWAAVVDRDLEVLVTPFPLSDSTADERDPAVDGDGTHWVVAYERGSFPDFDIACRQVSYVPAGGSVVVSSEHVVEGDVGQEERDPTVAWMGESTLIAWSEHFADSDFDVYLKSVESFGCLDCEGESPVATPSAVDAAPALVSRRSAGGTGPQALVSWVRTKPILNEVSTHARLFRADDGSLVDLGGGCGAGGMARATCAASGATSFGLALDGATPLQPCGLLLGLDRLDLVCGPCTLVLDPLVAFITTTDASGHAAFTFPMPGAVSFAGAQFLAQWFVRSPSCGNFSFSNALEITVE